MEKLARPDFYCAVLPKAKTPTKIFKVLERAFLPDFFEKRNWRELLGWIPYY